MRQTKSWGDQVESEKIGGVANRYQTNIGERSYLGEKSRKMQQRRKNLERRQERALEEKEGLLKNAEAPERLKLFPLKHHAERLLAFEEAAVGYGNGRSVCRPVNLQLRQGERVFLQGKNGCGKTSLIRLVLEQAGYAEYVLKSGQSGLSGTAAGSGTESRAGRLPAELTEGSLHMAAGLKISYVSQDTSGLSGNLRDYAQRSGVEEHLFFALLRKLDFSRELFDQPVEYYSQGQKKKVLIARSLCEQAHLYIWDEPLNYIDLYSRMQIEELILEFQPTMLLVEHDAAFMERVATAVLPVIRMEE